ncbi:protein-glutamate O-methyltransferase CheR [Sulfurimonas sp.]|nr:protein-glutamate O-methyltransferase CheR [Sulfurimonas sp.]
MSSIVLKESEFKVFQKIIYAEAGIDIDDKKILLVQSRLLKKLLDYKLSSYSEYLRLVQINTKEKTDMINLISTNETYFFREDEHFTFLSSLINKEFKNINMFRVWSAASSVGAEAYSSAMVIDSILPRDKWEIIGTDINSEVVKKARIGLYPESWITKIPDKYKRAYCLKGRGSQDGKFLIDRGLANNLHFKEANLLEPINNLGKFDIIFLRNVLIYFDDATKQRVVDNVANSLKTGGFFLISHTENLNMINLGTLEQVATAIYRKKI